MMPEERRDDREAHVAPSLGEVLDRRQDAVAGAALALGDPRVLEAAVGEPGLGGSDRCLVRHRLAVLGRDHLGLEIDVAAAVRPADVVEEQQRQRASAGAGSEQPEVLAHGVVVVVAVEDHGVGHSDVRQGVPASLVDEVQLGVLGGELDQPALRIRVDRDNPRLAAGGPAQQLTREAAREGADLGHRPGPRGVEAGEEDVGQVGQRVSDLLGFDAVALCLHAPGPEGIACRTPWADPSAPINGGS